MKREDNIPMKELEAKAKSTWILHRANEIEMLSMIFTAKMEKQNGVTIRMLVRILKKHKACGRMFPLHDT